MSRMIPGARLRVIAQMTNPHPTPIGCDVVTGPTDDVVIATLTITDLRRAMNQIDAMQKLQTEKTK